MNGDAADVEPGDVEGPCVVADDVVALSSLRDDVAWRGPVAASPDRSR